MDYQIGMVVVHKAHGLCEIKNQVKMGNIEYYEILPKSGERVTIYVPCACADNIFVHVISAEEADELLRYLKTIDDNVEVMTKQRRDDFKRRINNGDRRDLIYLFYKLKLLKQDRLSKNMDLGFQDQDLFDKAKRRLLDEFSLSYAVPRDQIAEFLNDRLERI